MQNKKTRRRAQTHQEINANDDRYNNLMFANKVVMKVLPGDTLVRYTHIPTQVSLTFENIRHLDTTYKNYMLEKLLAKVESSKKPRSFL